MAGNKSCEGKLTTLECMECGHREVFTERQFKFTDGLSCYVCNGPTRPAFTRQGDKIRNRRMDKELNRIGDINSKNGIDVANTLKGLKAIQREAKKATAALKELGSVEENKCPKCARLRVTTKISKSDLGEVHQKQCWGCGWHNEKIITNY